MPFAFHLLKTAMLPESQSFYIRGEDGDEYGPADMTELREWVRENRAGIGTEVRRDEPGGTWNDWQTYPELIALLAEVHVTSPVPGQPSLILAPLGRRISAFILDLILIIALWIPLMVTFALLYMPDFCNRFVDYCNAAIANPQVSPPPFLVPQPEEIELNLIFYFVVFLYMLIFTLAHGQTPAKAILRLRVVDESGGKPAPLKILIRAVSLVISMNLLCLPFTYAFFNPQRRAVHDFIAGTYVVEA
jgi:uncharacterized RDD family membrane protein YckC